MIMSIERCTCCRSLHIDGLEVDLQRYELRFAGQAVRLEPSEMAILYRLIEAEGAVVAYERIRTAIWGVDAGAHPDTADNVIRTRTYKIRRKLARVGAPYTIRARNSRGLMIEPQNARGTA